jgi:hypothetical protein
VSDIPDEITYRASVYPGRIYQDGSIRTVFSSDFTAQMVAVQAVLSAWLQQGIEVDVTVKQVATGGEKRTIPTRSERKSSRATA